MFFSPLSRAGDFHARSRFARSTILEGKPQPRPQGAFPWENKGYSQSTIFIAVRALAVVKIRGRRGGRGGGGGTPVIRVEVWSMLSGTHTLYKKLKQQHTRFPWVGEREHSIV